jgi:hypothetical protein
MASPNLPLDADVARLEWLDVNPSSAPSFDDS